MPHISINLYKGGDEKRKDTLTRAVQRALVENGPWKPSDISVSYMELNPEEFLDYVDSRIESEELVISSDYIE